MNREYIFLNFCIAIFFATGAFGVSCSNNYDEITGLSGSAFMAPVNNSCDAPGYALVTIPDEFELFYSGLIIGDEVTLCNNGHMQNGSCVSYTSGDCSNGNYTVATNTAFMAPVNNSCDAPNYRFATISDSFYWIYTGMLIGDEITLCNNGHMQDGSCVSYTSGDCISGYYDMGIDTNTFAAPANNACSNPYSTYANATRCDHNPGDTCVDIPTPTVNLTWLNYNGDTITTNVCYSGEPITLPTTPVRQGYKFTGWSVVQ